MTDITHSYATPRLIQSKPIDRDGQRVFIVQEDRRTDGAWVIRFTRIKTALNYWRNGYKWRASWILARR